MHLDVGVHQVSVLSYKGFLDISHDAGVHLGEPLGAVDLHIILSPLPLCWDTLWEQEVSASRHKPAALLIYLTSLHNMTIMVFFLIYIHISFIFH